VFDLDVYGGVIATRFDNDEIDTIADLKNKIIGAGAIVDLMGGQMQIYEMQKNGMSYVNDPKQVIFMKDQDLVVEGILSGRLDAGFIRTNQIELTKDKNGNHINTELFKVIDPKVHVLYVHLETLCIIFYFGTFVSHSISSLLLLIQRKWGIVPIFA
jgi:hypothetical protein